jgi:DNA-binding CsgD family transcriptional regulator
MLSPGSAPLLRLLPKIYEAGVDPDKWEPVLRAVAKWLDATASAIAVHHFGLNEGTIYRAVGYDPKRVRDYNERYAAENVWLRSANAYQPAGRVLIGEDIIPERELEQSSFYQDWLKPQGLHHRICGVLHREHAGVVYIAVMRPPRAKPFLVEEAERLSAVLPHLERGVQLQRRIAVLRTERSVAQEALDLLPRGVLFVDHTGRVLALNRRAQEILRVADGLMMRDGILHAAALSENTGLHRMIADSVRTAAGAAAQTQDTLALSRLSGRRPLEVLVLPLRSRCELLGHNRARAVVFVTDPDIPLDRNEERLRQLYGLTRAEARLATALVHAGSLEEAAAAAGITGSTARGYLTRIFARTGVNRRAELVRLILIGPAQLRRMPEAARNPK